MEMRKELYQLLCDELSKLYEVDGEYVRIAGNTFPSGAKRLIHHIDLWNHKVEYIEQEAGWSRPAVFVEFGVIRWMPIERGIEYRANVTVNLHVVTDWEGSAAAGSEFVEESLRVFDLLDFIHQNLSRLSGGTFTNFDLLESATNHNHEEIIENIETYSCTATKVLPQRVNL